MATIPLPGGLEISEEELVRYVWTTGIFMEERLDPLQLELHTMFDGLAPRSRVFILEGRKIGKTYGLLAYMDAFARRRPGSIIRFACETKEQAKLIVIPLLEELQQDCPEDLKWISREHQEGCWVLPHTGSRLYLVGTDDRKQVERLRGPRADLIILDEVCAYSFPDLPYLINSVLSPQTINTGGHIIMCGTPPTSLEHPSIEFINLAKKANLLFTKTLFDNPRLSQDQIVMICKEANPYASDEDIIRILAGTLEGSPSWEREYMCRMVADKEARVTPEFDSRIHVKPTSLLTHAQKYVFIDAGFVRDFFAATFCELDFSTQTMQVRAEYHSLRRSTNEIRTSLQKIENDLKWDQKEYVNTRRFMDPTAHQQIFDFAKGGYYVMPGVKNPGKGQVVVEIRNILKSRRILIDPACKNLISCMDNGIWSSTAKEDFKRSKALGHLDVLDSLAHGTLTLKNMGAWQVAPWDASLDAERKAGGVIVVPGMSSNDAPNLTRKRSLSYTLSKIFTTRRR